MFTIQNIAIGRERCRTAKLDNVDIEYNVVLHTLLRVSDVSQIGALIHSAETSMSADAGYVGALERDELRQKLQGMPHAVR